MKYEKKTTFFTWKRNTLILFVAENAVDRQKTPEVVNLLQL